MVFIKQNIANGLFENAKVVFDYIQSIINLENMAANQKTLLLSDGRGEV